VPITTPVLIVLEGANDLEFIKRLTNRLRQDRPELPDLLRWQATGCVVLVPVGGGSPASWSSRFEPLGLSEFHLYDREQAPESAARQAAVDRVNARDHCYGALTAKRSLENYLHPEAIAAAGGGTVAFNDHDSVALLLACRWYEQSVGTTLWPALSPRSQRRLAARAKRWLNTQAIEQMNLALLAECDPDGEVLGWLQVIGELVTA
jgi:putative ATP-dependent endonuclease of OLD family